MGSVSFSMFDCRWACSEWRKGPPHEEGDRTPTSNGTVEPIDERTEPKVAGHRMSKHSQECTAPRTGVRAASKVYR
jgi:hypothetical protein